MLEEYPAIFFRPKNSANGNTWSVWNVFPNDEVRRDTVFKRLQIGCQWDSVLNCYEFKKGTTTAYTGEQL